MRSPFIHRLALYLAPFLVVFGLPMFVMIVSGEMLAPDELAARHAERPTSLYGAAYTNPDARYKLTSLLNSGAKTTVIGSSRALQFQSDFFVDGEKEFYNAGLLVERLWEFRRVIPRITKNSGVTRMLLAIDQWNFTVECPKAVDNPAYEMEIGDAQSDVLSKFKSSLSVWPDAVKGKLDPTVLLDNLSGPRNLGVNAITRGNGFRHDGSYLSGERLRNPAAARDYQLKDSLTRFAAGARPYERGDEVLEEALAEARRLVQTSRALGIEVVGFLPPFAPTMTALLDASPRHAYLTRLGPALAKIFAEQGYPFFDFTSCVSLGCTDADFLDGFHPGAKVDAVLLLEMARSVEWLRGAIDVEALRARIDRSEASPSLAVPLNEVSDAKR